MPKKKPHKKKKHTPKRKKFWFRSSVLVVLVIFLLSWTYVVIKFGAMKAIDNVMFYSGGLSGVTLIAMIVGWLLNKRWKFIKI